MQWRGKDEEGAQDQSQKTPRRTAPCRLMIDEARRCGGTSDIDVKRSGGGPPSPPPDSHALQVMPPYSELGSQEKVIARHGPGTMALAPFVQNTEPKEPECYI